LQSFEDAKNLIGIASDRKAVNDLILKDAVGVDEEQPAHGHLLPFEVHAVGATDSSVRVGSEWKTQRPKSAVRRPSS
jgi:hypothetical protein